MHVPGLDEAGLDVSCLVVSCGADVGMTDPGSAESVTWNGGCSAAPDAPNVATVLVPDASSALVRASARALLTILSGLES